MLLLTKLPQRSATGRSALSAARPRRSDELALDPIELALHVVDDVAALHRRRQHVPRVRLDLELRRELVLLVELERVLDREARRLKMLADLVEEHRHVDVRAPLALE